MEKMSNTDIDNLYAHGQITMAHRELGLLGIDGDLADFLAARGLPKMAPENPLLGVRFREPSIVQGAFDAEVVTVADETWSDGLYIGIERSTGHILGNSDQPGAAVFINSSLIQFLRFLAAAQEFLSRASRSSDQASAMTLQQARDRLAALRRGDIQPSANADPFDRSAEIERMRELLRQVDPVALTPDTWWDRVLEQMDDGVI